MCRTKIEENQNMGKKIFVKSKGGTLLELEGTLTLQFFGKYSLCFLKFLKILIKAKNFKKIIIRSHGILIKAKLNGIFHGQSKA